MLSGPLQRVFRLHRDPATWIPHSEEGNSFSCIPYYPKDPPLWQKSHLLLQALFIWGHRSCNDTFHSWLFPVWWADKWKHKRRKKKSKKHAKRDIVSDPHQKTQLARRVEATPCQALIFLPSISNGIWVFIISSTSPPSHQPPCPDTVARVIWI